MARKRRKRIICPNCQSQLKEHMNYCFNCGQENHITRVSLKMLFRDFTATYFSFDSKLFKSLKYLLIRPSFLSTEYLEGRMQQYLTPVRLYVFISFVFFVLVGLKSSDTIDPVKVSDSVKNSVKEELNKEGLDEVYEYKSIFSDYKSMEQKVGAVFGNKKEINSFIRYMESKLPILLFLLIPVLGMLLFLFFYKKDYYYIDHLVFALHLQSFCFVLLIVNATIDWIFGVGFEFIVALLFLIYGFIAARKYYKRKILGTLFRLGFVGMFHLIIGLFLLGTFFLILLEFYKL